MIKIIIGITTLVQNMTNVRSVNIKSCQGYLCTCHIIFMVFDFVIVNYHF